ncbi:MAG TPA: hypothetical protein VGS80_26330 [Ktedonobacterales bacterium]|nr:hypothetical protein [Ktedonobacterales bacterium]
MHRSPPAALHLRRPVLAVLCALILLSACASQTNLADRASGQSATPGAAASPTRTQTATSGVTATATKTASHSPAPYGFPLIPPGQTLPTEAACAALVHRSTWEPRPDNYAANHHVPTPSQIAALAPWDESIGVDPKADTLRRQITGNFTGTTDEILQWTACKWGVPVDIVRAEAVVESYWHQSQLGDWTTNQSYCPPGTWNGSGCYQSYGILQLKWYYFQSTWPMSRANTAFNAEYIYGVIRTCFEGWTTYLNDATPLPGYPKYHAGDIWGCLGRWFSGTWYDQGAVDYIAKVQSILAQKVWLQSGF